MTVTTQQGRLAGLSKAQQVALLCRTSPGVWASVVRGYSNAPVHWEWYELLMTVSRGCIVAPREHGKTEVLTVNATAWRSIYRAGTWTYIFAQTADQSSKIKERIDAAVREARPDLVDGAFVNSTKESVYANGSAVTVAGAGKAVRGAHPDVIIGDDVLSEETSMTAFQRDQTERWWKGTVSNMAHPGTTRVLATGKRVTLAPTQVFLVGTPFHRKDLLMGMKDNPLYVYRRYASEFREADLVPGTLAVEAS